MRKPYISAKFFKNINQFINKLLEKNLNKLNSKNLISIIKSNKIFVTSVALIILFLSYLSIPNIYNQNDVKKELKNELFAKFKLNLNFSKKLQYNFFPRPHFSTQETLIFYDGNEISKIKNLKIYISLKNLFSVDNLFINDVILEGANFNLNKFNHNFFINLLNNKFLNTTLKINNSKIFYRSVENEVLFINKIFEMKYYFDEKNLNNVFYSDNELFNIPYSIKIFNDNDQKKLFTKLDLNLLRLLIDNQYSYKNKIKIGSSIISLNNEKSEFNFKKNQNLFEFNYFDKQDNKTFSYNGKLFFKPFYSNIKGDIDKLNISFVLNSNSIITQLLKTEIFNNKNLNINFNLSSKKILNYNNFVNILLNCKIKEGLIDVDDTQFDWKNRANVRLFNSLIFIKDGELILDANTQIRITNNIEVYKFFQSPKKLRKKIKKIDLNFTYNFDKKIININEVKIDNISNQKVTDIFKNISVKSDDLQNKIYFKKLINTALKNYAG